MQHFLLEELARLVMGLFSSYIDDEKIARISSFCRAAEIDFQSLAGPRNVSVDLKYDVLCS